MSFLRWVPILIRSHCPQLPCQKHAPWNLTNVQTRPKNKIPRRHKTAQNNPRLHPKHLEPILPPHPVSVHHPLVNHSIVHRHVFIAHGLKIIAAQNLRFRENDGIDGAMFQGEYQTTAVWCARSDFHPKIQAEKRLH